MLSVGKHIKNAMLLASDENNETNLWFVKDQEYPTQTPRGDIMGLISADWLLKSIFKKYSLKRDEIKTLLNFYKDPDVMTLDVGDNWRFRQALSSLEAKMVSVLKNRIRDPSANFVVNHDPKTMLSLAFIGPSRSGKTTKAVSIICDDIRFNKRKCYVFTTNPTDPALLRLKERGKKTIFVDLDKITSPLDLKRDFPPGCLIFCDDVLDTLSRRDDANGFNLRKTLLHIVNQCLLHGRHHAKKGQPGVSLFLCTHIIRGSQDTKVLHSESTNVYLYPTNSNAKIKDYLLKTVGLHKDDISNILKMSEGTRWLYFRINSRPLICIWKTGAYLL